MLNPERTHGGLPEQTSPVRITTLLALLLVVSLFAAFACSTGSPVATSQPGSYFASLAEGFLHGQTYFTVQPDPRLAELANPYAGYQGIPRWHDTTYYNGHYYLYFGATPAVLLHVPWHLLTGTWLTDPAVATLLCIAGFLFAAGIWLGAVRRFFPDLAAGWVNAGVLVLGLGTLLPYLLQSPTVYQVAISCGYSLLMAALYALFRAIDTRGAPSRLTWLAVSSLAWGAAIGARPNYVYSLPVLGIATLVLAFRVRGLGSRFQAGRMIATLAAGIVPAACVGVALALYNYVRFGSVTEFGVTYQLASVDVRKIKLFGPENLWPNLRAYLFDPNFVTRYFPFVFQGGNACGMVYWTPFALLGLALPFTWLGSSWRRLPGWVGFGAVVFVTACAQLGGLLVIAFQSERYELDFVPSLTLAAVLVLGFVGTSRPALRLFWALLRWAFGAVAVVTVFIGVMFAADRSPVRKDFAGIGRLFNYPAHWAERIAGTRFGPVSGELTFGPGAVATREPLIATSRGRDVLFAERLPNNQVRFGFFHYGTMTPVSEPVTVEPGKPYSFTFDVGSLYPATEHPRFARFPRNAVDALRRRVRVIWDGHLVLDTASAMYPSSPGLLKIGENPEALNTLPRISGSITGLARGGIPDFETLAGARGSGPVRLTLKFPSFVSVYGEPLISTGAPLKGDLVFVTYLAPGRLKIGHDSMSGGAVQTRPLNFDPAVVHTIDVDAPMLSPGSGADSTSGRINIRFDGKLVLSAQRQFAPTSALDTVFGYNAVESSAASALFTGPSLKAARLSHFEAPQKSSAQWGAVRLTVALPQGRTGISEPLVCTGQTGKGNIVFVRYVSENQIQVGYDHWGVGSTISEPITVDYHTNHQFEVSVGSLYPELGDPWWSQGSNRSKAAKQTVLVKLNDEIVLNTPYASHPSSREDIVVGINPIGGSTAESAFTGEIQAVENIPVPEEIK